MVERQTLVNKQGINYEGIFVVKDLYDFFDLFMKKFGYSRKNITNGEYVKKSGRDIEMIFELQKPITEYYASVIRINMQLKGIKDIEIEKEGYKINANQGTVSFALDCISQQDFEHKWENKPGFFFIRILFDRYLFKPFTTNYQALVMKDYTYFVNEIKAKLNLYRY